MSNKRGQTHKKESFVIPLSWLPQATVLEGQGGGPGRGGGEGFCVLAVLFFYLTIRCELVPGLCLHALRGHIFLHGT